MPAGGVREPVLRLSLLVVVEVAVVAVVAVVVVAVVVAVLAVVVVFAVVVVVVVRSSPQRWAAASRSAPKTYNII